jgi:hypothetical protein
MIAGPVTVRASHLLLATEGKGSSSRLARLYVVARFLLRVVPLRCKTEDYRDAVRQNATAIDESIARPVPKIASVDNQLPAPSWRGVSTNRTNLTHRPARGATSGASELIRIVRIGAKSSGSSGVICGARGVMVA